MKLVEEPLFKSYVFVKIGEDERSAVRMTTGVINFVYWNGKPAVVKDREIQAIRLFLNEHENVQVQKIDVLPDQRVRVISGPLMDHEGKVVSVTPKTVRIAIESLGYMLVALDKSKVARAEDPQ